MKTSDIMTHDVIALTSDDTTGKALNIMYEKRIIETTIQYFKDKTESFDDYYPCRKSNCRLQHIQKWFNLFVSHYNNNLFS